MWKLKIKLNFDFIIIIIVLANFGLGQGMFIDNKADLIHSLFGDYSKRHNLKDYNYRLSYGLLFRGKTQVSISYIKDNQYYRGNNSGVEVNDWEEYTSISLSYYLKPKRFLSYGAKTTYTIPYKNNHKEQASFSFLINKKFSGNIETGLVYVPYAEFKKEYYGEYFTVLKNIKDASKLYKDSDNIELGCYITFNDFWVKPYYRENLDRSIKYEGIEIGFWDKAFR